MMHVVPKKHFFDFFSLRKYCTNNSMVLVVFIESRTNSSLELSYMVLNGSFSLVVWLMSFRIQSESCRIQWTASRCVLNVHERFIEQRKCTTKSCDTLSMVTKSVRLFIMTFMVMSYGNNLIIWSLSVRAKYLLKIL